MHFIYHSPHTVVHPASIITHISVLYDGGCRGFSLAMVTCEGLPHVAMRWNVANKEQQDPHKQRGHVICTGSPAVGVTPAWFILPRELFNPALFDKESSQFLQLVSSWNTR